jgi:hypothetical protein
MGTFDITIASSVPCAIGAVSVASAAEFRHYGRFNITWPVGQDLHLFALWCRLSWDDRSNNLPFFLLPSQRVAIIGVYEADRIKNPI